MKKFNDARAPLTMLKVKMKILADKMRPSMYFVTNSNKFAQSNRNSSTRSSTTLHWPRPLTHCRLSCILHLQMFNSMCNLKSDMLGLHRCSRRPPQSYIVVVTHICLLPSYIYIYIYICVHTYVRKHPMLHACSGNPQLVAHASPGWYQPCTSFLRLRLPSRRS